MNDSPGTTDFRARGLCRGARWCAAVLASVVLTARPQPVDEFVLKAQALVELSPFFTWSEPRDPDQHFIIVVVGKSPFGASLDAYARRRAIRGRRIEIRYAQKVSEVRPCDLVFICRSERRNAAEILDWARGKGVLTVADDEELLKSGIVVDLLAESGLLRLYVDPAAASMAKLAVSSQLLRIARIVDSR